VRLFQFRTAYQFLGAIVHGLHNPQTIATGCADPSYRPVLTVGGASRGDYVQDERYIARSTRMCGAIVSVVHGI
jgi:hypothetical protein